MYRYYSTQRPVAPGTIPPTSKFPPLEVINYDARILVENNTMQDWGEIHYLFPLTAQQISDYELKPAPDNPPMPQRSRTSGKNQKTHHYR